MVEDLAFAADGRALATIQDNGSVTLWDVATGRPRSLLGRTSDQLGVVRGLDKSVTFSPDGRFLAWTSLHGVVVYELATGRLQDGFGGESPPCIALTFSPDGGTLAVATTERSKFFGPTLIAVVLLRDAATGKSKAIFRSGTSPIKSLAFSPDGRILAARGTHNVFLWDVPASRHRVTLGHEGFSCEGASFAPDGRTLATCDLKGVNLWDVATGKFLGAMAASGPERPAAALSFLPDGKSVMVMEQRDRPTTWAVDGPRFLAERAVDDMPRLRGAWKLTRSHGGDIDVPGLAATWNFTGDTLDISRTITKRGDLRYDSSRPSGRYEETYDGIDGLASLGLFSVQGDRLQLYKPDVPGAALPTSIPEVPLPGYALEEWKRESLPGKGTLEGRWKLTGGRRGRSAGRPVEPWDTTMTVTGPRYEVIRNEHLSGTVALETATVPKRLDLVINTPAWMRGRVRLLGLYRMDGDRLTVTESYNVRPLALNDRPGEFGDYDIFERVRP
ncbi:MAG: hypothetical protein U0835_16445 [Isosphaeraceae bacterium]